MARCTSPWMTTWTPLTLYMHNLYTHRHDTLWYTPNLKHETHDIHLNIPCIDMYILGNYKNLFINSDITDFNSEFLVGFSYSRIKWNHYEYECFKRIILFRQSAPVKTFEVSQHSLWVIITKNNVLDVPFAFIFVGPIKLYQIDFVLLQFPNTCLKISTNHIKIFERKLQNAFVGSAFTVFWTSLSLNSGSQRRLGSSISLLLTWSGWSRP